ncbi:shikimate kinase [Desulfolucanica intricata]|uniref:shikimate kinase n=1 Tax=Desulfolucanica intricata TaxID=1285191 RepID=UPI0008319C88|nr:shikimate kinase [Desulfolucanica intricata]
MYNVVLIGFMGTGKTVVGKRLAARLNKKFIDTDAEIEKVTGKTIEQIFARDGVIRFRSEETLLARKLENQENTVISTGGGMVLDPENIRLFKKNGIIIGLSASPEIIYQRVKHKRNRPLLNKGDLKTKIKELLDERTESYKVAEFTIDTGDKKVEEVVDIIISYLDDRKSRNHEKS